MSLFKIITPHILPSPFVVADHHVIASNVAEVDHAEYDPALAYSVVGTRVIIKAPSATVTMGVSNPVVVTWTAFSLPAKSPVRLTTTGALLTGLSTSLTYYVKTKLTADTFTISERPGGAELAASGTQSGVHTMTATRHDIYEVVSAVGIGEHPVVFPAKWVRVGATNKWKMLDSSTSSQTTNPDSIDYTFRTIGRADAVALMGVKAATAQVIVTDTIDGEVYNKTTSGIQTDGIVTPSAWFFDPIEFKQEMDFTDIPTAFSSTDIQVILTNTGNTVLCSNCILGKLYSPGHTQVGINLGIEDFSIKNTDDFGNFQLSERGFSRQMDLTVLMQNTQIGKLHDLLSDYRATAAIYIGMSEYGSTMVFGYYERFNTLIRYPTYSILTLELRGLT